MTQKKNIVLSTTEPITDGGRKYNFLYFIGAIAGFILGICLGNFGGGIFFCRNWYAGSLGDKKFNMQFYGE